MSGRFLIITGNMTIDTQRIVKRWWSGLQLKFAMLVNLEDKLKFINQLLYESKQHICTDEIQSLLIEKRELVLTCPL